MPFSESLAERVRQQLRATRGVVEKRMFGGLVFLLNGNMLVCVWHVSLIARVGPGEHAAALAEPHVKPFDVGGRTMRGWALVEPEGVDTDRQLRAWLDRALAFVEALPAK
ncbi:MAG: TfoX/Sxy family protein [Planctomycetes bacterium]|nr:TfoX/Sxy family protein [Planctomycetota bacterium]